MYMYMYMYMYMCGFCVDSGQLLTGQCLTGVFQIAGSSRCCNGRRRVLSAQFTDQFFFTLLVSFESLGGAVAATAIGKTKKHRTPRNRGRNFAKNHDFVPVSINSFDFKQEFY